jgi:peptide deformylase
MSILRIVTTTDADSAILRTRAREVSKFDRALKRLVHDMIDTMREAPGVGLAAPQIGRDLRLIVVETPLPPADPELEEDGPTALFAVVNPEVTWRSETLVEDQEACLSIPGLFGDVPRHTAIRVTGLDPNGRPLSLELQDFEARVFQHEIDHLEGILYLDRVTSLEKLYTLRKLPDGSHERLPYLAPA